jgi:hypothetical protein
VCRCSLGCASQSATNFCTNSFKAHGGQLVLKDQKQSAMNAAAAGTVLLCITNYAVSASAIRSLNSNPSNGCAPAAAGCKQQIDLHDGIAGRVGTRRPSRERILQPL